MTSPWDNLGPWLRKSLCKPESTKCDSKGSRIYLPTTDGNLVDHILLGDNNDELSEEECLLIKLLNKTLVFIAQKNYKHTIFPTYASFEDAIKGVEVTRLRKRKNNEPDTLPPSKRAQGNTPTTRDPVTMELRRQMVVGSHNPDIGGTSRDGNEGHMQTYTMGQINSTNACAFLSKLIPNAVKHSVTIWGVLEQVHSDRLTLCLPVLPNEINPIDWIASVIKLQLRKLNYRPHTGKSIPQLLSPLAQKGDFDCFKDVCSMVTITHCTLWRVDPGPPLVVPNYYRGNTTDTRIARIAAIITLLFFQHNNYNVHKPPIDPEILSIVISNTHSILGACLQMSTDQSLSSTRVRALLQALSKPGPSIIDSITHDMVSPLNHQVATVTGGGLNHLLQVREDAVLCGNLGYTVGEGPHLFQLGYDKHKNETRLSFTNACTNSPKSGEYYKHAEFIRKLFPTNALPVGLVEALIKEARILNKKIDLGTVLFHIVQIKHGNYELVEKIRAKKLPAPPHSDLFVTLPEPSTHYELEDLYRLALHHAIKTYLNIDNCCNISDTYKVDTNSLMVKYILDRSTVYKMITLVEGASTVDQWTSTLQLMNSEHYRRLCTDSKPSVGTVTKVLSAILEGDLNPQIVLRQTCNDVNGTAFASVQKLAQTNTDSTTCEWLTYLHELTGIIYTWSSDNIVQLIKSVLLTLGQEGQLCETLDQFYTRQLKELKVPFHPLHLSDGEMLYAMRKSSNAPQANYLQLYSLNTNSINHRAIDSTLIAHFTHPDLNSFSITQTPITKLPSSTELLTFCLVQGYKAREHNLRMCSQYIRYCVHYWEWLCSKLNILSLTIPYVFETHPYLQDEVLGLKDFMKEHFFHSAYVTKKWLDEHRGTSKTIDPGRIIPKTALKLHTQQCDFWYVKGSEQKGTPPILHLIFIPRTASDLTGSLARIITMYYVSYKRLQCTMSIKEGEFTPVYTYLSSSSVPRSTITTKYWCSKQSEVKHLTWDMPKELMNMQPNCQNSTLQHLGRKLFWEESKDTEDIRPVWQSIY